MTKQLLGLGALVTTLTRFWRKATSSISTRSNQMMTQCMRCLGLGAWWGWSSQSSTPSRLMASAPMTPHLSIDPNTGDEKLTSKLRALMSQWSMSKSSVTLKSTPSMTGRTLPDGNCLWRSLSKATQEDDWLEDPLVSHQEEGAELAHSTS